MVLSILWCALGLSLGKCAFFFPCYQKVKGFHICLSWFWVLFLFFLGVAVLEGPMYAVGGHDGWSYLNTVERWDPQARQWNFVASMSTPRSTVGVAILNGK